MSDPALAVRAGRLRAARGVVVTRDVALTAAPGDVVAVDPAGCWGWRVPGTGWGNLYPVPDAQER